MAFYKQFYLNQNNSNIKHKSRNDAAILLSISDIISLQMKMYYNIKIIFTWCSYFSLYRNSKNQV